MKFFGVVWRGLRSDRLDFGGDPDHDTDAGFLNPDYDPDPGFLTASLFTIAIPTDSQE